MPLTIAQRRKQNQLNAQKSTGPTTQEGKNISRGNSLIHGLAAQVLMLPDEQLDGVEAQANAWTEACQPQGHDEETLVGQLTLTSLRLARIARAEAATLSEQVRNARTDWHMVQEYKLVECTRLLRTDPAIALIDLKSFGAGVEWMIEKWLGLQDAFKRFECWNTLALIKDAIRLQGGDPEQMRFEPLPMQEFALVACSCVESHSEIPAFAAFLSQRSPEWVGRYPNLTCPPAEARKMIAKHIEERIADLVGHAEDLKKAEEQAQIAAQTRAASPEDTSRNRLMYRYMRSAESSLERTLKLLQKMQAERAKAQEKETKEAAKAKFRNEPKVADESPSTPIEEGSCITIAGKEYEVREASGGNLVMILRSSAMDLIDPGEEAAA